MSPEALGSSPLLQDAMETAGFHLDIQDPQPGAWISSDGIPVDLMVPDAVSGTGSSRRSPSIPPHDKMATRKAKGLEAALIDNAPMRITALQAGDDRVFEVLVAGPSALIVAKLHKISERLEQPKKRQLPKDSHDVFRLMRDVPIERFADGFAALTDAPVSADVTTEAIDNLESLFVRRGGAGAQQAGATIAAVGDADAVALRCSVLGACGGGGRRGARGLVGPRGPRQILAWRDDQHVPALLHIGRSPRLTPERDAAIHHARDRSPTSRPWPHSPGSRVVVRDLEWQVVSMERQANC